MNYFYYESKFIFFSVRGRGGGGGEGEMGVSRVSKFFIQRTFCGWGARVSEFFLLRIQN